VTPATPKVAIFEIDHADIVFAQVSCCRSKIVEHSLLPDVSAGSILFGAPGQRPDPHAGQNAQQGQTNPGLDHRARFNAGHNHFSVAIGSKQLAPGGLQRFFDTFPADNGYQ